MEDQTSGSGHVFVIPFLPPTSNKIYITNWRKKVRFLSQEAATFKKRAVSHIQQEYPAIIHQPRGDEAIFRLWYAFYFKRDELLNKTYGSGKKDAAASRYKRMDVENRLKLVSDSFATAIGIDDCRFFEGGHTKLCCDLVGGTPQVQIHFWQVDPKRFGL